MNKIKRALLRPTSGRWWRWIWTTLVVFAVLTNVVAGLGGVIAGRVGFMWVISATVAVYLTWSWSRDLMKWIKEDDQHDKYKRDVKSGRGPLNTDDGIVLVVPSSEAVSPFHYAMMRALETENGVSIYCDDEGVWRDSDTDEPLPVQGERDDDTQA